MRIAFIIDTLYPFELGGAHKRVWEIGRRLSDDHDVHVFGMKYWEGADSIRQDGMVYHGVCQKRELYSNGRRSFSQPIIFAASLLKEIRGMDFDIIDCQKSGYFHFFSAKYLELRTNATLIGTFNEVWGDYWDEYLGIFGRIGKLIENQTLKLPSHIITISNQNQSELIGLGYSSNNITVIPDGIGFQEINQASPSNTSFDVLYAGRLARHKNVDLLLKAIKVASSQPDTPISCGIIGKGPEMEELKRQSEILGLSEQVEFLGFLEDIDDVYSYMKSAKVFVLPSSREGAGLVTLEANACGTPSITPRFEMNAATEVIDHGTNGYLCDPDPKSMASSILETIQQSPNMREDCIKYSKEFEWGVIAESTEQVYEQSVKE